MPGIGTRSWLPPILAEPDDWFGADDDPWGAAARPEPIGTAPATAAVPAAVSYTHLTLPTNREV